MTDSSDSTGYAGQAGLTSGNNSRNASHFQTKQQVAKVRTMVPVKIVAVYGGGVGPAPTADVQILMNQLDGQNNATPHTVVYGIQCPRNMPGNMAIINDPVVGDMGWMHVADQDISSFVSANGQASPGSKRRHHLSDGVFVRGHDSQGTPKQYIQARSDGVTINDVNDMQIMSDAKGWHIKGDVFISGNVTSGSGTPDSVTLQNHTHPTAPPGPASAPTGGT